MKIEGYITIDGTFQKKAPTDEEIIKNLERIGLKHSGNNYRIEKKVEIAINDFKTLCFDETNDFDKRLKESILLQGRHSRTKLYI